MLFININKIKTRVNFLFKTFSSQFKPKQSEEKALIVREKTEITLYSKKFVSDCRLLESKPCTTSKNSDKNDSTLVTIQTNVITEIPKTDNTSVTTQTNIITEIPKNEDKLNIENNVTKSKNENNVNHDIKNTEYSKKNYEFGDANKTNKHESKDNDKKDEPINKNNKKQPSGLNFDFVDIFLRQTCINTVQLFWLCRDNSHTFVAVIFLLNQILWIMGWIFYIFNLLSEFILVVISNYSDSRNWNMRNKKLYKRVKFLNMANRFFCLFFDKDEVNHQINKFSSWLGYSEKCRVDQLFTFFDEIARWSFSVVIRNISQIISDLNGESIHNINSRLRQSPFWVLMNEILILVSRVLLLIALNWVKIVLIIAWYYTAPYIDIVGFLYAIVNKF